VTVQDLLALPYDERRLIVVAATPATAVGQPAAGPTEGTAGAAPGKRASALAYGAALLAGAAATPLFPTTSIVALAATAFAKSRREMQQGGENILPVSPADAAGLQFPVGHPRRKVVYVGHPLDPPVYIPLGDFHRFLFEHKVAEALRLIRSLGAVAVEVVRVEGWDQTVGITLGAAIPGTAADVGASAGRERSSGYAVLSTMRLSPTQAPFTPPGLVWLPHEPLWQEVAQARLESGLDSFVIDVRSTDDYGVNAGLRALVAKAGLEAGGSFVEHRSTIWRLRGAFS
jgi:hypothetical protein